MTTKDLTIKIKVKRLRTVKEVKQLLTYFENAYNPIYVFDFIVNTFSNYHKQRSSQLNKIFQRLENLLKESSDRKDFQYDSLIFTLFLESHFHNTIESKLDLLELLCKIDIGKIVLPQDFLKISKVTYNLQDFVNSWVQPTH